MIGAYILIILGVAVWAAAIPLGRRIPDGVVRGITVFGGAFLLGVCFLHLVPEMAESGQRLPFYAVLLGFLIQQLLDGLTAHAEHGHLEGERLTVKGESMLGLMVGLSLHALLEGMPLVGVDGQVDRSLLYGIVIHNIPVALIMVGMMTGHGYSFWRVLCLLVLFGAMSPLGSLFNIYVLQPDEGVQHIVQGLVVGVLLHVSSSILFDHKHNSFTWLNTGLTLTAFLLVFFTIH
ncbi:MAG: ZIP family metal transporter [Bacteroidales bacterium]|nr:ZIP family metal transporter [Bacteroidales bacterium]